MRRSPRRAITGCYPSPGHLAGFSGDFAARKKNARGSIATPFPGLCRNSLASTCAPDCPRGANSWHSPPRGTRAARAPSETPSLPPLKFPVTHSAATCSDRARNPLRRDVGRKPAEANVCHEGEQVRRKCISMMQDASGKGISRSKWAS